MDMITTLGQRVKEDGSATITAAEYEQLQAELAARAGADGYAPAESPGPALEETGALKSFSSHSHETYNFSVRFCSKEYEKGHVTGISLKVPGLATSIDANSGLQQTALDAEIVAMHNLAAVVRPLAGDLAAASVYLYRDAIHKREVDLRKKKEEGDIATGTWE